MVCHDLAPSSKLTSGLLRAPHVCEKVGEALTSHGLHRQCSCPGLNTRGPPGGGSRLGVMAGEAIDVRRARTDVANVLRTFLKATIGHGYQPFSLCASTSQFGFAGNSRRTRTLSPGCEDGFQPNCCYVAESCLTVLCLPIYSTAASATSCISRTQDSPACRNKFVKGVCELPRIKCGDCPKARHLPRLRFQLTALR